MPDSREQYAEKGLAAVNDAANAVSSRFVTFVSVGAYVAVTVAATTHEMLLRASSVVTLPLLNAQIPIIGPFGFYSIAPWLVVLLHSDLLLQLSILSRDLERFEKQTEPLEPEQREMLRQRVANFYYVLYLTGQASSRFLHLLSAFITWVTAVVLPLALLLWIQIRFLPFHGEWQTRLHRAAVVADVALIVFILMPHVRSSWKMDRAGWRLALGRALSVPTLLVAACAATLFLSLFVARLPGDDGEQRSWFPQNMQLRERVLTANVLTPQEINELRDSPAEKLPDVLSKVTPFQALQGRDFRYADLYNAVLPKLDLRAVRPESATAPEPLPADCDGRRGCDDPPECIEKDLVRTRLAGANFSWASMQQAMFDDAVLDGADLSWAKVQYGSFSRASMNGANLSFARLASARLEGAKLCGADLREADLRKGSLARAWLQGATLRGAQLAGTSLEGADLRGADLSGADLSGAALRDAKLQGAVLRGAKLEGVTLDGANVEGTDLSSSRAGDRGGQNVELLVELSCRHEAAAEGIARQAVESPARSEALVRALLDARQRPDCRGIASLSAERIAQLEQRLAVPARQAAAPVEGTR